MSGPASRETSPPDSGTAEETPADPGGLPLSRVRERGSGGEGRSRPAGSEGYPRSAGGEGRPPGSGGEGPPADPSIWANRAFLLLWAAQAVGQTAQNAVNYGLMVLVQTATGSAAHMSVAVLTVVLPSVVLGLVAGAYVDRRDKRLVLIATTLARAALMPLYVLLPGWLGLLYAVNALFSAVSQFFAPAEMAMLPVVVERRRLLQANSLFHVTFTASQLAGLVLLGPLLANLVGVDGLFWAVGVALLVAAALLWPLPSTHNPVQDQVLGFRQLWGEIGFVLRYVRTDRVIAWAVVQWTIGTTLALIVATLAPPFVVSVLGVRAEDSVFVLAPAGIGTVVGSVLLGRHGDHLNRRRTIEVALMVLGALLGLMALVAPLWIWAGWLAGPAGSDPGAGGDPGGLGWYTSVGAIAVLATLAGFAFVAVVVPAQTLIQERALPDVRGRLFAVQMVLANVASIVPLVALGELADLIGVGRALVLVGAVVAGAGLASTRLSNLNTALAGSPPPPDSLPHARETGSLRAR